jgi:hypothetical protein
VFPHIIFDYPKQFVDKTETGNVIKNLKVEKKNKE